MTPAAPLSGMLARASGQAVVCAGTPDLTLGNATHVYSDQARLTEARAACAGGRRKPAGAPAAARRCRGAAPPRRSGALPAAPGRRRGLTQRCGRRMRCGDHAAARVAAVGGRASRCRGRLLSGREACCAARRCGQRPWRGRHARRRWLSLRARVRQSGGRRRRHSCTLRPTAAEVRMQSGHGQHALVRAGLEAPVCFAWGWTA